MVDDSVKDIRKEIESDMGDLTERVSEISARMVSSQPSRVTVTRDTQREFKRQKEDKKNVLSKKSSLKSSRIYKDVFIHSDQSK